MNIRTPAALVAAAALLTVAAGGTGYAAARITGQDVVNNSLTGADVRSNSLLSSDVRDNNLTSRDVRNNSLTGVDVRNRTIGVADVAPVVRRQVVVPRSVTKSSSASNDNLQSDCLAGEQAVGGQAGINSGSIVGLSYFDPGGAPVVNDGVVTGWRASWFNANNNNNTFEVTALCMSPAG